MGNKDKKNNYLNLFLTLILILTILIISFFVIRYFRLGFKKITGKNILPKLTLDLYNPDSFMQYDY